MVAMVIRTKGMVALMMVALRMVVTVKGGSGHDYKGAKGAVATGMIEEVKAELVLELVPVTWTAMLRYPTDFPA